MTLHNHKKSDTASKYRGVSKHTNGKYHYWVVRIRANGKSNYIACYRFNKFGEREAAERYNKEAKKLYGDNAKLNEL